MSIAQPPGLVQWEQRRVMVEFENNPILAVALARRSGRRAAGGNRFKRFLFYCGSLPPG
ncbi:MAG TPA: hypothetical protein VJV21_01155 [Pyrinomonadaceae bacterium]|nr:hypothetical protein [Pyrinomonadaceae bacterium]